MYEESVNFLCKFLLSPIYIDFVTHMLMARYNKTTRSN